MPTYIFKEKGKKGLIEKQMKISELDEFKINNPNLKQVPTAPSFRLKGTGWYETDFKTGKKRNLLKEDTDKKTSTDKDKTPSKKDEKKTVEKSQDKGKKLTKE